MSEINKLQWSKFIGPDRSEQVVVRSDDKEEFQALIDFVRNTFAPSSAPQVKHNTYGDEEAEWANRVGAEPKVNVDELPLNPGAPGYNKTNPYEETGDAHICTIHHKQMKERTNRKTGGVFYDHRMKDEAGNWLACVGKGYMPSNF